MYRLLLAVDTDEERSNRLANAVTDLPVDRSQLNVTILNVFEDVDSVGEEGTVHSSQFYNESNYPDSVRSAAKALTEAGFDVTKRREHGDPADVIVEVAKEINAKSIGVCGRKRSPTGKVIFGSVAQSVMLSANRPVFVTMAD